MKTLQELGLFAVATLIKSANPSLVHNMKVTDESNPFLGYPSNLVESLLIHVAILSHRQTVKFIDLKLLLSCHRIKNFELCDVSMTTPDFVQIIHALSKQGENLIKFVLKRIFLTDFYSASTYAYGVTSDKRDSSCARTVSLQRLFSVTTNLRCLMTDVPFNTKLLQNLKFLEKVDLAFFPSVGSFCNLVPSSGVAPNLRHIAIVENSLHCLPKEDILFLLERCPNLVTFDNSIAEALELLKANSKDGLNDLPTFNLRRTVLGNAFLNEKGASVETIRMAVQMCPFLADLDVFVDDHSAIRELRNMKFLQHLLLQWGKLNQCDFNESLLSVLEHLGHQLRSLHIINFRNVDFAAVASLCPDLRVFKVEYCGEVFSFTIPKDCFSKLEMLDVEVIDGPSPSEELLRMLLSNCTKLKVLAISDASSFNDHLLDVLLRTNGFDQLIDLALIDCSLSDEGLVRLLTSCSNLKLLYCSSTELSMEEIILIMSVVSPNVMFRRL